MLQRKVRWLWRELGEQYHDMQRFTNIVLNLCMKYDLTGGPGTIQDALNAWMSEASKLTQFFFADVKTF